MENEVKEEVKVETKKKGNGLFTVFACVMTGVIVFMATNLGDKASKVVDPDTNGGNTTTSNVESNVTSNIESNITSQITSNVVSNTTNAKLTDADALAVGKDLYKKADYYYPLPLAKGINEVCTDYPANNEYLDCTTLYAELQKVYVANHEVFKQFTLKDGKYLYYEGGIGFIGSNETTLTLKSNELDKLTFTATTVSTYPGQDGQADETKTVTADFVVVKENGTWKVSVYTFIPANTLK